MENVSEDNIFLSLREKNIVSFDTPVSIKLTVADIIGKLQGIRELLSTRTFLHDGGLFSVSGLDQERRFWREFLT